MQHLLGLPGGRGRGGFGRMQPTLPVDRKIEIVNVAVLAEDLVEVVFVDILRQSLDNNLHNSPVS